MGEILINGPPWTHRQAYDMPQYAMTGQGHDRILKEMQSPITEGTHDSQDSCSSPNGRKSPKSPSKVEIARDELEKLKEKQVELMRDKNKWLEGLEIMKAIFDKMKHSKDCLEETCRDIMKNNNLSDQLDNDDFPVLSAGHASDKTGNQLSETEHSCRNHVKQGTQRSLDDNNNMKHEVQYNLRPGQIFPRKDSLDDCCDKTEYCLKDTLCYVISPDGRCGDQDLSDASDDSTKSPSSDDYEHSFNAGFSPTHNEHHNQHNPKYYTQLNEHSSTHYTQYNDHSGAHLTQYIENCPTTEHDVINNNSKEETNYTWVVEKLPQGTMKSYVEILASLHNVENDCQTPQRTETPINSNTKLTGKRPSSSLEMPRPIRRQRLIYKHESCLRKPPGANTVDVESVLATGKESALESENSKEVHQATEKLSVRELTKEELLADNNADGEQSAKQTKGEDATGKTGNIREKTQAEVGRSAKECQLNGGNLETDSEVLNKTIVGAAKDDSSSKVEPTATNMQQAGEHNTEAALTSVDSSIVLGKDETNVNYKVETDSVNNTYETMTDNCKEERARTENIAKDGDHKSAQSPKEVPKIFGTETSECTRMHDNTKRDEEHAAQHTDAGTLIGDESQVEASKVDENGEEGQAPNDEAKLSTALENTHDQVESDMFSLKEDDLNKNSAINYDSSNICDSSNTCDSSSTCDNSSTCNSFSICDSSNTCDSSSKTCSATKEVPQVVKDTQVKIALVDDDSKSDCICILERRTMHDLTPPSRRIKNISTTDCHEARDINIVETAKADKTAAISFVEHSHPNKLNEAKGFDHNTEYVGCDDAESEDNIRQRASGIDNNREENLKTKDRTEENDAASDSSIEKTRVTVNTLVNQTGMNAENSASQQNTVTADEDDPRIQTMRYSTDWRGRLFFILISLATLLCVFLATLLPYLNA